MLGQFAGYHTAHELLEEERDGAVERYTALEENLAARCVEEKLADRVEDRARLGLACAREQVADRNAVLELVDRRRGKNGADIVLDVPVGTVVKDAETDEVLFDLTEDGQERILCQGGKFPSACADHGVRAGGHRDAHRRCRGRVPHRHWS